MPTALLLITTCTRRPRHRYPRQLQELGLRSQCGVKQYADTCKGMSIVCHLELAQRLEGARP